MTTADSAGRAAAQADARSGWTVWRRPRLPDANQGGGFAYAFVSFVIGFAILAWPFFEAAQFGYGGGAIIGMLVIAAPAAGGFFVLTVVIASVTVILREIRQAAFEAALRAGEVESRAR